MAKLDPWSYAAKTRTEHAEQVALFMWANMACNFGIEAANDPQSYNVPGYAQQHWGLNGFGSRYCSIRGKSIPVLSVHAVAELKWLHSIHNQGHGDAVRGAKAKAEGVKVGVADVFLPVPMGRRMEIEPGRESGGLFWHSGLYLELKRKEGGTPSIDQLDFQNDMRNAGYKAEIVHGWEAARDEILSYLEK